MKLQRCNATKLVSLLLVLCMLAGMLPTVLQQPAEAYNASNAPVATDAQLQTFERVFTLTYGGGGMRIINGELYVWGCNSGNELGMYTKNPETGEWTAVPTSTSYLSPVRHPLNDELGADDSFSKVQGESGAGFALTEKGRLFFWGASTSYYGGASLVPKELLTDLVTANGDRIVDFYGGNVGFLAVAESGRLYFAGEYMGYTDYAQYTADMQVNYRLFPMSQHTEDTLQEHYDASLDETALQTKLTEYGEQEGGAKRRRIYKGFICGQAYGSLLITETNGVPDGLYTSGDAHTFGATNTYTPAKPYYPVTDVDRYPKNAELVAEGIDYGTAAGSTQTCAVIDSSGSVWVTSNRINDNGVAHPIKIFDAAEKTVRAKKVYVSNDMIMILAQDNSVWAFGKNAYQFLDPTQASSAWILETSTPLFQEISATQTITGCHVSAKGVMVITKSGDIYWNGDNSSGTAGNGTDTNPEGGGTVSANPTNIDPLEPVTTNGIFMEIELEEDGTRYRLSDDDKGELLRSVKSAGVYQAYEPYAGKVSITAGTKFLLNVYFTDFAKLTGFIVPIRFDPKYVEVINDNGVAYAQNTESTPGAINGTTGIHETFGSAWSGGYLVGEAGEDGTYPKICNTGGWLSVSGHTLNRKAYIDGTVKMFTVRFNVKNKTDSNKLTTFILADNTSANTKAFNAPASATGAYALYDDSATGANNGACFQIPSSKDDDVPGVFSLHLPKSGWVCPQFETVLILAQNLAIRLQKSDGGAVSDGKVTIGSEDHPHPTLALGNTSEVYSVVSSLTSPDGIPSFQDVAWTFVVNASNEDATGSVPIADYYDYRAYLTIVDEGLKTLKFKVSSDLPEQLAAVITITATTKVAQESNKFLSQSVTVNLKNMEAPKSIQITEKTNYAGYTVVYNSTDENKLPSDVKLKFTASFPDDLGNANANMAVTWHLLDKNGNELTSADSNAAAYLETPTLGSGTPGTAGFTPPSVTVRPCHTTAGEDYLILRLESAYNSNVYDEMYIKVHLDATELKFKQELLRMPVDSSRDLNSLLLIAPENDYYEVDLEWTWLGLQTGIDGNGKPVYRTDAAFTRVSSGGILTSLSEATNPADAAEVYQVRDRISGESATIKVQTLKLTSPITADDVTVKNVVGDLADEIVVTGLEKGDIIIFYQDYSRDYDLKYIDTAQNKVSEAFLTAKSEGRVQLFTVTASQAAQSSITFSVQHFLDGQGGELGVSVYAKKTIGGVEFPIQEFDKVPVSYDAEPSKVYGYISLAGKAAGERLAGIAIQLTGLSNPDVVYTDANGYFEFKTYIQPGSYTMNIYQDNYLRRIIKPDKTTGYAGITIPSAAEFAISTKSDPIILYPGDLNGDGAINATDINQYLRSWFGKSSKDMSTGNFAHYDFYDGAYEVIDLIDLDYVARHNGWTRESYPNWYVPQVK